MRCLGRRSAKSPRESCVSVAESTDTPQFEFVRTRLVDGVFELTLDRPKINAINIQMDLDWLHALQAAEADDRVAVVLQRAEGRMFTAGHDLEEVGAILKNLEDPSDWSGVYAQIWPEGSPLDFTAEITKPLLAAVHGQVVGQGVYQALASDIVIAAQGTVFNMEVARTGGAAGVSSLTGLIPPKLVNELAYVGRLSAEVLLSAGGINRVVPRAELDAVAMTLAASIARVHPSSLGAHKTAMKGTFARQNLGDFASGFDAIRDSHGNDDDNEFWSAASERGVREALAWRDERFGPAVR